MTSDGEIQPAFLNLQRRDDISSIRRQVDGQPNRPPAPRKEPPNRRKDPPRKPPREKPPVEEPPRPPAPEPGDPEPDKPPIGDPPSSARHSRGQNTHGTRKNTIIALAIPLWAVALFLPGCAAVSESPQSIPQSSTLSASKPKDRAASAAKEDDKSGLASKRASKNDKNEVKSAGCPVQSGQASWYGPGFDGKTTASGETFDDDQLTAAHPNLPFGTMAKVTSLENGKSVEVKINDRGPYVDGRVIDLSRAAARLLGIVESGVAEVEIEKCG